MRLSLSQLCSILYPPSLSPLVAEPIISVDIKDMGVPFVGNNIVLTCAVTLTGVKADIDVGVALNWLKDGGSLTDSSRITVTPVMSVLGHLVSGSVEFMSLEESDAGVYTCQAVITPLVGDVPPLTASEDFSLTLISESCGHPSHTHTHTHTHTKATVTVTFQFVNKGFCSVSYHRCCLLQFRRKEAVRMRYGLLDRAPRNL